MHHCMCVTKMSTGDMEESFYTFLEEGFRQFFGKYKETKTIKKKSTQNKPTCFFLFPVTFLNYTVFSYHHLRTLFSCSLNLCTTKNSSILNSKFEKNKRTQCSIVIFRIYYKFIIRLIYKN